MDFKEMTLEQVKAKLYFITAQPKSNEEMLAMVQEEEDCFGRGFTEEGEFCRDCIAAARIKGTPDERTRWEPLRVWCRELCQKDEDEEVKEVKRITRKF